MGWENFISDGTSPIVIAVQASRICSMTGSIASSSAARFKSTIENSPVLERAAAVSSQSPLLNPETLAAMAAVMPFAAMVAIVPINMSAQYSDRVWRSISRPIETKKRVSSKSLNGSTSAKIR